ncbi:MAG: 4Fe-4S dicluster domain-containing protein [Spirochaetales bacterium]|nr:MAG: 4Fe-4S dicluster domain-containing protein [Spirochaetales bacterium]
MNGPKASSPATNIYRQLSRRIDKLPVPYPETASGVELRLLQALFTPAEAEIALSLSALAEPVAVIQRRVNGIDEKELEALLSGLVAKGAISAGITRVGKRRVRTYGLAPLVVGMFEFQVDKLTPEYVKDFHEYMDEGFRESIMGARTGQMRTVPIRAELSSARSVAPYNDIRSYVAEHPGPFGVINCVCRQSAEVMGEACTTSSSHETCLMIGHVPGHARRLDREGVLEILDRAEREGHVLQPQNSQTPAFICCCCTDCCEVLRNARKLPRPADAMPTAFRAQVDESLCTGCRVCVKRCPMEAISTVERRATVNEGRCIGCGLCASTCPESAIDLMQMEGRRRTPRNNTAIYLSMYADRRGLLGIAGIAIRKVLGLKV